MFFDIEQIFPRIQWHEGMMLLPHHFQRLNARAEVLAAYRASLVQPFFWGVVRLEFDRVAILEGMFRVTRLEAVMPDGLLIDYHESEKRTQLEIDFSDQVSAAQAVKIHIAVAKDVEGNFRKRYLSEESEPIPDVNVNENEVTIPVLFPNIRLVFSDSVTNDMTQFPLIEVGVRDEAMTLTSFIPPQIRVRKDSELGKRYSKILELLRRKALVLEDRFKSAAPDSAGRHVGELRYNIERIASGLPGAEALYYSDCAHPFNLYVMMCDMTGRLALLGQSLLAPLFDPYDHNDLDKSFRQLETFIENEIAQLVESYTMITIKAENKRFNVAPTLIIPKAPVILGVKLPVGMTENDLQDWINHLVIVSENQLTDALRRRVLGADRRLIRYYEPLGLVPPSGIGLLLVDNENTYIVEKQPLIIEDAMGMAPFTAPDTLILYLRSD